MQNHSFKFTVDAENPAEAGVGAQALADKLREAEGVTEVDRQKADPTTMDLGSIVQIAQIVAGSSATLSLAQGIAAWLRARRGVTLRIERDGKSGSIKAAVEGIDPESALRIVEIVREG